jgi:hypothetical protein
MTKAAPAPDAAYAAWLAHRDAPESGLCLSDAAYLYLSSFARGDLVTVSGHGRTISGEVTVPLTPHGNDPQAAWLYVRGAGEDSVTVTVTDLIDGRWLIATCDDADNGRWQPFDPYGHRMTADPELAGQWRAGFRDGAAAGVDDWFPHHPAVSWTDEQYWAYVEGWALAHADPEALLADFVDSFRATARVGQNAMTAMARTMQAEVDTLFADQNTRRRARH